MMDLPKLPWTMDIGFNGVDGVFGSMCPTPDLENQRSSQGLIYHTNEFIHTLLVGAFT